MPVEPRQLAALERQIPQLEQEHAELSAHWQEQKTLVAQLLASRNPEVSSLRPAAENQSEITAELVDAEAPETVLAALAELQQSQGILIHHEVTPQVVAEVDSHSGRKSD